MVQCSPGVLGVTRWIFHHCHVQPAHHVLFWAASWEEGLFCFPCLFTDLSFGGFLAWIPSSTLVRCLGLVARLEWTSGQPALPSPPVRSCGGVTVECLGGSESICWPSPFSLWALSVLVSGGLLGLQWFWLQFESL